MTPNLIGRWQTRLYLLGLIGGLIALLFVWRYNMAVSPHRLARWAPLVVVGYLILFGFVWDVIYQFITRRQWDYDWPGAYTLIAGVLEGALVFLLIRFVGLPFIVSATGVRKGAVDFGHFLLEYAVIWTFTYFWVQFLMRAIFIRWRFRAARFG